MSEEVGVIQSLLDRVPTTTDPVERATLMEEAESRLRGAAGTKRSFKMEIRLVQDLRTLKADLKALQADENRGELFVQGGGGGGEDGNGEMDPTQAGSNMLADAAALQDKTQDSLANTRNLIAQSKEVGVSTLEELQRQREVIQNIDRETDRLDDNLARAEALLKQFGKRMAGDKFIQCFAVINCLLLIGVVIYAIRKNGSILPQDEGPSNPTRMLREGGY